MPRIHGQTQGLKPSQLKRLENLYRRRLPMDQLVLPEQALALARLSAELGRQVGLVVSRRGEVAQVVAGGPESLPAPDLSRLRHGSARLAGYALIHTTLGDGGLSGQDLTGLLRTRWDLVAALPVSADGLPGLVEVMHLLPQPVQGQDTRRLTPFPPGQSPEDLAALVRALEEELARQSAGVSLGREGNALLVSVTSGPRAGAEDSLDELAELAASAGLSLAGRIIQRRPKPDPRTLLGPGKLNEVLVMATRLGADLLVVDQELSPGQAHTLALATGSHLKFIDRTQLILDIFAQRARTREGKLQVEMAQMRYLLPRLSLRDDGLSRLTGGIGGRGPGETRLEMDRRRVRERLHRLERELKEMGRQRSRRRDKRRSLGLPVISIVGYTNAGKSTLLNTLTKAEVLAEDRLFATLDPTSRRLRFPREREAIVTDTVGFIRDLPSELAKAFAATLEELAEADLLLHLADAANPQVEEQITAVERLLEELDLHLLPTLLVLNKMDRADPEVLEALRQRHQALAISAIQPATCLPLLTRLEELVDGLRPPLPPRAEEAAEDGEEWS